MSEKVTYTNNKGLSVELGNEGPFVLTKIEGTGAVAMEMQTQKSPYQDGVTYIDGTLEPRIMSIEVTLLAGSIEEMAARRRQMLSAFNPKCGAGVLKYRLGSLEKEILAIPEQAPVFPSAKPFEDRMQRGLIQLYCPNPFFTDIKEHTEEIVTWIGGLCFPLTLPVAFATKGKEPRRAIRNLGDVPTPVEITFKGPATNPKVTNISTGEYVKVKETIVSGQTLSITTEFGKKRVEIRDEGGNVTNAFNKIDLESTFWSLEPGENLIEYSSDDPDEPAEVYIKHKNRYIGV